MYDQGEKVLHVKDIKNYLLLDQSYYLLGININCRIIYVKIT
jgi:hypothetical protein